MNILVGYIFLRGVREDELMKEIRFVEGFVEDWRRIRRVY